MSDVESRYLDPHHVGQSDEDFTTGFEPTVLDRPMSRSEESARFYGGLLDLFERRVARLYAKTGPDWKHYVGPVYDPTRGGAGDGRTCPKCRRISGLRLRPRLRRPWVPRSLFGDRPALADAGRWHGHPPGADVLPVSRFPGVTEAAVFGGEGDADDEGLQVLGTDASPHRGTVRE